MGCFCEFTLLLLPRPQNRRLAFDFDSLRLKLGPWAHTFKLKDAPELTCVPFIPESENVGATTPASEEMPAFMRKRGWEEGLTCRLTWLRSLNDPVPGQR